MERERKKTRIREWNRKRREEKRTKRVRRVPCRQMNPKQFLAGRASLMLWTLTALTDPPGNHAALATPRKTPSILQSLASCSLLSLLWSFSPLENTLFLFLFLSLGLVLSFFALSCSIYSVSICSLYSSVSSKVLIYLFSFFFSSCSLFVFFICFRSFELGSHKRRTLFSMVHRRVSRYV